MSKRFTDTDKWKDEWFLSLSNDYRIVWQYILDNCSNAGLLKKNFKLLNFCCGIELDESKFLKVFNGRIVNYKDFYFLPKFLKFQYPKGLNSDKPAIVGVRNEIIEKGLLGIVRKQLGNNYLIIKDKDKDKDKEKNKEKERRAFVPPSIQDVKNYAKEKGYTEAIAIRAFEHYEAGNWYDTYGKPVKNWKQKILTNWFKPEHKIKEADDDFPK